MPRFDLSPYPYLGDMGQNPPVTLEDESSQDVIGYVVFITIYGCFQKEGLPQNGWFIMEHPIKMNDLGGKPTIYGITHIVSKSLQLGLWDPFFKWPKVFMAYK